MLRTCILAGALASVAARPPPRVALAVGEVIELDVDYKVGVRCDDPTLLRTWMISRAGRNRFVVEGVATGATWCRVGTDPSFSSYLIEIVVEEP